MKPSPARHQDEGDSAVDDLIELVGVVHGLLRQQAAFDVQNLERHLGRTLRGADKREIEAAVLNAKRHTVIESGITHPSFQALFGMVTTPAQRETVKWALSAELSPAA